MIAPGFDVAWAVLCSGLTLLAFVALAWFALRVGRHRIGDGRAGARSLLNRRLAAGEIDVEEYYERESALRHSDGQ